MTNPFTPEEEAKMMYFITVDWCDQGRRGVFCDEDGHCFRKDGEPHNELEMQELLDAFWIILNPRSEPFTEQELSEFTIFLPLAEYKYKYGIAVKEPQCSPQKN